MQKKWTWILIVILAALAFGLSAAVYTRLPAQVASHWNMQGQPDDTMPRFWGLALVPLMMLGLSLLLMWIPSIDPLRKNIETFRPAYHVFIVMLNVYLLYIHVLTVLWNLGLRYDFNLAFVPAVALFFYVTAELLGKSRRNWFIGFRTPWTLSSDMVWEKTHHRAELLFKIAAGLMLLGLVFPDLFLVILFVPLLPALVYLVVYSYLLYRQEHHTTG